jgi:hypothetical protein
MYMRSLMTCTPHQIIQVIKLRQVIWAGHIAHIGERRAAYRILVRRPEGRKSLGRPRHRWKDSIKMGLQEVGWGAWLGLIWLERGTGVRLL